MKKMNHRSIILKKIGVVVLLIVMQVTSLPLSVLSTATAQALAEKEASSSATPSELAIKNVEIDPYALLIEEEKVQAVLSTTSDIQSNNSAAFRVGAAIHKPQKDHFKAQEEIAVVAFNSRNSDLTAEVLTEDGTKMNVWVQQMMRGDATIVRVLPPANFKPGKYTLSVSDGNYSSMSQDFTWGVLAVNTNKSLYLPQETAHLALAVLDDKGSMVCNAQVNLEIRNPDNEIRSLSTDNGLIKVNPECQTKDYTQKPDYEAVYQVGGVGTYEMTLTAETQNGTRSITDSFEVRESILFDVERFTATRIYPVLEYPVKIEVTATQDFEGTITESVPTDFQVSHLEEDTIMSYDQARVVTRETLVKENVLGASTTLAMPFEGSFAKSGDFGDKELDPLLKKKYAQYGVVGHDGMDFALPSGTPVMAVDSGEVVIAQENWDYGTTVVIQHSWGKTYYGHLSKLKVKKGDKVVRGSQIALSGNTGLSTGPHLHFSVKPNTNDFGNGYYGKVDPSPFLGYDANPAVLGLSAVSNEDEPVQLLSWDVSLKKGDKITLGYQYKAPEISPQFYTLGPASFTQGNTVLFQEERQWQIAVDDTATKQWTFNTDLEGWSLSAPGAAWATNQRVTTDNSGGTGNTAGALEAALSGKNRSATMTSEIAFNPSTTFSGITTTALTAQQTTARKTPVWTTPGATNVLKWDLIVYHTDGSSKTIVMAANVNLTSNTPWTDATIPASPASITADSGKTLNLNTNWILRATYSLSTGNNNSAFVEVFNDNVRLTMNWTPPSTTSTVGTAGTQVADVTKGTTNQYLGGAFTMSTNTGTASVTSITLSEQGTISASSHLSNIDIYYETAGTCTYNGTETLFGTDTTVTTEQAVVTGSMSVGTSQVCLYVVADVSGSATAGQTIEIQITDPSTQVSVSTGTVSPGTAVAISGTTTVQDPPTFTLNNYRWYNNAASSSTANGGPVKIDDAGDPGIMSGHGRQVLRTSTGTLYAMIGDGGVCEVWKSTDGTSWAQQDSIDSPTNCNVVSAAIDSNDAIHMVYINISTLRVRYVAYDTATDSFALDEEIMTNGQTTLLQTDIALDSNNKPHVLAVRGGTFDTLTYANKVSGAWSTVDIAGAASSIHARNPSITISEDDIPEVAYIDHTNADVVAAVGNANNTTSFTSQVIDIQAQTTAGVAGTSIGVDSSGNTWVAYADDGATDIIMLQSHPDASAWSSGWSATWDSALEVGYEPSLAIDGTDIYVFYENDLDDVVYDMYDGASWSGEVALQTGTFQDVKARWAFSNNYDSTGVGNSSNTYYFDGSDVAAVDSNNAWTNETNTDDGSTTTFATATTAHYGEGVNNLKIEGTNAPASGGTIVGVRARVHNGAVWGSYVTVNAPTGGWSWSAVQGLEAAVFGDNSIFVSSGAMIYENADYQGTILATPVVDLNGASANVSRVEILVQTSDDQNELDYLYSDGTDVYWASVGLGMSVNLGSAKANENTAASSVSTASPIRLRSGITLGGSDLAAGAVQFKLQYGTSTSGPWTDVGTGDWAFEDNANISDGVELSSTVLTGTDVAQTYEEDNPTVANISAMTVGQDGEWDFSLDPTNASADTTYYFRMVKSDGTALDTYTRYPTLTMASTGGGGIAFVKQTTGKSTVATTSETFSVTSTAGNTLILMTTIAAGSTVRLTGVTDSAGNTWVVPAAGQNQNPPSNYVSGSNTYFAMAYVVNASAITSITITTSASDDFGFNLVEFSGIVTASPVDQSASAGNIAATSQTTPSITTTNATDLIIGGLTTPSTTRTLNTSGYTALTDWDTSSATIGKGSGAYRIVSAIGTYSITWDLGASQAVGTGIMAFKGTGGGGAETPTLSQLMRHGKWFNSSGARQPFTF